MYPKLGVFLDLGQYNIVDVNRKFKRNMILNFKEKAFLRKTCTYNFKVQKIRKMI